MQQPDPNDLASASDQRLVTLVRAGSEAAFTELYRRYVEPVRRVIYKKVRDEERTEDLTQDTFFKVFKNLHRYNRKFAFGRWIRAIAHNTATDHWRTRRADAASDPRSVQFSALDAAGIHDRQDSFPPTLRPLSPDMHSLLEWAIERLERADYRECLRLRVFDDLSYKEIAQRMHIAEGTVGTFLHRAGAQLKQTVLELIADVEAGRVRLQDINADVERRRS